MIKGVCMNVDVKNRLESTLKKYGISKASCGRDMGYSSSIISAYCTGNYAGDVEKLEANIERWISRQDRAHQKKKVPVVETSSLKAVMNAIEIAHTEKDIALIIADAGSGKTTAAKRYAEVNEKTVIYIPVVAGMNKKMLVCEVAKQLSLETARVPFNVLVNDVAESLAEKDSLVILDEADYLKADALEFCRRLVNDLGDSGLVLIGLPRLKGMILNLKNDHSQLASRIGVYLPLVGLSKPDARTIARSVWAECSDDVVSAMYEISGTDVRTFCKIIERMQNTLIANNMTMPDTDVVGMAGSMVLRRR